MSEVKLENGYWVYGETTLLAELGTEDIDERIQFYSTQVANLSLIREFIANSDYQNAVNAMKSNASGQVRYGDRFIDGYMAALEQKDSSHVDQ